MAQSPVVGRHGSNGSDGTLSHANGYAGEAGGGGAAIFDQPVTYFNEAYASGIGGAGGNGGNGILSGSTEGAAGASGAGGDGYAYTNGRLQNIANGTVSAIALGGAGGNAGVAYGVGTTNSGTGGTGGKGGDAYARAIGFSSNNVYNSHFKSEAVATGGAGGNGSVLASSAFPHNYGGGSGGAGGGAVVQATAFGQDTITQNVYATAQATGGAGGTGFWVGASGGAGGIATVAYVPPAGPSVPTPITATGKNASVHVDQRGGAGGYGAVGAQGGAGAASELTNAVSGTALDTSTGVLSLTQNAFGGAGGNSDRGAGGQGGQAGSYLTFSDPSSTPNLTGTAYAKGGAGGIGYTDGTNGAGGNARATISLTGHQSVNAHATAIAQSGAQSTATTAANGSNGSAVSNATSVTSGLVSFTLAGVTAGIHADSVTTNSQAKTGGDGAGLNGTADTAYAFSTAVPDASYVATQLVGHSNVSAVLGIAGAVVFGAGAEGSYYAPTPTGEYEYQVSTYWQIDSTQLSGDLVAGLLGSQTFGAGFSSLDFSISENGTLVPGSIQHFTAATLGNAQIFFSDHALDLGTIFSSTTLQIVVTLDLKTTTATTGFGANFLLGATACFLARTAIRTTTGDRYVEDLRKGDRVVTQDGGSRPIVWIGHRRIDIAAHPSPDRVLPIRIRQDAFADGLPQRDLLVSPDHAIFTDGVLIAARQLVNGATIMQDTPYRSVLYFHVELDRHDVLLAEALPAESYLDTGNRDMFANGPGAAAIHPLFDTGAGHPDRGAGACARLAVDAETVEPVWRRLNARAASLGHRPTAQAITTDPDLLLQTEHETLRPAFRQDGSQVFVLRRPSRFVRLLSRAARPADARPWLDDRRTLGVRVRDLAFDDGIARRDVPLDHPALAQGWLDTERTANTLARWTNGSAMLDLPLSTGLLHVRLAGEMQYPLESPRSLPTVAAA